MPALQPTADQFRAFRDDPHDGPIAQVNLLELCQELLTTRPASPAPGG